MTVGKFIYLDMAHDPHHDTALHRAPLNMPLPKIDGLKQVTGEAEYIQVCACIGGQMRVCMSCSMHVCWDTVYHYSLR